MVYSQVGPINEIISCHPCGSDLMIEADMDLDGTPDLLFYSEIDQKMAWVKNDGQGNFVSRTRLPDYKGIFDIIQLADLDGDGDIDVFFTSNAEKTIGWFENDQGGQFNTPPIIISNEIDQARYGDLGDIDMDGDIDIVTSSSIDKETIIFKNDGQGIFSIEQVIEGERGTTILYLEDLDGDRDLDLYAVHGSGLVWFRNDGTGHFETLTLIDDFTWEGFADFADLDGDGDTDILTSRDREDQLGWYENDGAGQFKEKRIYGTITEGSGGPVKSIDMDMDGDMDIVTYQGSIDKDLFWYENDGLGNFSATKSITKEIKWLNSFEVVDLDGDGDLDVAVGNKFNERVRWFEQIVDGTYEEHIILFTEVLRLADIQTEDLDNDGDQDILAVGRDDGTVSWFANNGQGVFSEKIVITKKQEMNGTALSLIHI